MAKNKDGQLNKGTVPTPAPVMGTVRPENTMERHDPEKAERILAALASGKPIRHIMREEHVGWELITALRQRNPEKYELYRTRMAHKAQVAAEGIMDRIIEKTAQESMQENGKEISLRDYMVSWGILEDKIANLNDRPALITENRQGPSIQDARDYILETMKRVRAESIDV